METPVDVPAVVKSSFMNNGKMIFGVVLVIILGIVFFIWTMYKRMKRLETQTKESQKLNNEVTNIKYALQETINNVDGLRRRNIPQPVKSKVPVPVQKVKEQPAEIPTRKLTIEEVKPKVVTKKKKVTKSSLRAMKKGELIKLAKSDFDTDFDSSLTKTNLVNKVYQLYHKK